MEIIISNTYDDLVKVKSSNGKYALAKKIDSGYERLTPYVTDIEYSYGKKVFKFTDRIGKGELTFYIKKDNLENFLNTSIQCSIKNEEDYRNMKIFFSTDIDKYPFETYDRFINHITMHPSIYEQYSYEIEEVNTFATPFDDLVAFKPKLRSKIALGKIRKDSIEPVSPFVDEVNYIPEYSCYELIDNLDSELISLHFFVDENAKIMGTAYTNDLNNMLNLELSSSDDKYLFETYYLFREELKKYIEKTKQHISECNRKNACKMLALAKRQKENS